MIDVQNEFYLNHLILKHNLVTTIGNESWNRIMRQINSTAWEMARTQTLPHITALIGDAVLGNRG